MRHPPQETPRQDTLGYAPSTWWSPRGRKRKEAAQAPTKAGAAVIAVALTLIAAAVAATAAIYLHDTADPEVPADRPPTVKVLRSV